MEASLNPCVDCGRAWESTPSDREFYAQRGWTYPKRCPDCRRQRREWRKQTDLAALDAREGYWAAR